MKTGFAIALTMVSLQLGLVSCTTIGGDRGQFATHQREVALQLEKQGRLAEAIVRWEYVAAVRPSDSEATSAQQRLKQEIKAKSERLNARGRQALAKGQVRQAKAYFQEALAYDQENREARHQLAEIELRELWRRQKNKDKRNAQGNLYE